MTFCDLMKIIMGAVPIGPSALIGFKTHGILGALIGFLVGLTVGLISAFCVYQAERICWGWYLLCTKKGQPTRLPQKIAGLVYVLGFVWIIFAAFLAVRMTLHISQLFVS